MGSPPKKPGRILRSSICIVQLKDDVFYTTSEVARMDADPAAEGTKYRRYLESLGSFSRNHAFQLKEAKNIGGRQAWKGRYWKKHVKPSDIEWAKQQLILRQASKGGQEDNILTQSYWKALIWLSIFQPGVQVSKRYILAAVLTVGFLTGYREQGIRVESAGKPSFNGINVR